jgi:hypothetical protein
VNGLPLAVMRVAEGRGNTDGSNTGDNAQRFEHGRGWRITVDESDCRHGVLQMNGGHMSPAEPEIGLAKRKGKTGRKDGRMQNASGYREEAKICRRKAAAFSWEQRR